MPHPTDRLFCEPLEARDLLSAGPWLGAVLPADVDGDGFRDVAVLRTTQVDIYRGTPGGGYEAPVTLDLGFNGAAMTASGGGLLVRGWSDDGQERAALLSLGDGPVSLTAPLAPDQPLTRGPVVADLNGDGHDDVLTLDEKGRILLREGLPGETPRLGVAHLLAPEAPAVDGIGIAATADGPLLFGLERGTGRVLFFERDASGKYVPRFGPELTNAGTVAQPPGMEAGSVVSLPGGLAALDLARHQVQVFGQVDGALSVVRTIDVGPGIVGLAHTSRGLLAATASGQVLELGAEGRLTPLAMVDLDNDGQDDLIYAQLTDSRVYIRSSNGREVAIDMGEEGRLAHVLLADLDGDGHHDLIVGDEAGKRVLIYLGLGDGSFGPEVHGGKGVQLTGVPAFVTAARLRDTMPPGLLDLVVVSPGTDQVSVLLGAAGAAGWAVALTRTLNVGVRPTSVAVADLTGNGVMDLIVSSSGDNSIKIVPGHGDGSFDDSSPRSLPTGPQPTRVVTGDFNGDGRTDVVSLNTGGGDLTYYSDAASPTTQGQSVPAGGQGPSSVMVRDVDGDGADDLIVGSHRDGHVSLISGGPDGPSVSQTYRTPSGSVTGLAEGPGGESFWVMDEDGVWRMSFDVSGPVLGPAPPTDPVDASPEEPSPEPPGPALDLEPLEAGALPLVPIWGGPARDERREDDGPGEESSLLPSAFGGEDAELPGELQPGGSDVVAVAEEAAAEEVVVADDQAPLNRFLLGAEEVLPPDLAPDGTSEPPVPLPVMPRPAVADPVARRDEAEEKEERENAGPARSLFGAAALLAGWRLDRRRKKKTQS